MNLDFTRGGRGKIAPYETTHVRIPKCLKGYVQVMSDEFKKAVNENTENDFHINLTKAFGKYRDKPVNELKIISLAREVVKLRKQKKSYKQTLDNLLTTILEDDIDNQD